MKDIFLAGVFFLMVLSLWGARPDAAVEAAGLTPRPVHIEKTFDHGTLVTHTLTRMSPPHTVSLQVSQRRVAVGSEDIAHTYLGFRHRASEVAPPLTLVEFETLFADLMTAFQDKIGSDLVPESLDSGGFLGIGEVEKRSIQAFRDFAPWEAYLAKPSAYTQWQIHGIVLERWRAAKVFAPVVAALARAGCEMELSGFEKLFVFKATEFKTYPDLEAYGIPDNQKFPYPGTVAFTIKARR